MTFANLNNTALLPTPNQCASPSIQLHKSTHPFSWSSTTYLLPVHATRARARQLPDLPQSNHSSNIRTCLAAGAVPHARRWPPPHQPRPPSRSAGCFVPSPPPRPPPPPIPQHNHDRSHRRQNHSCHALHHAPQESLPRESLPQDPPPAGRRRRRGSLLRRRLLRIFRWRRM